MPLPTLGPPVHPTVFELLPFLVFTPRATNSDGLDGMSLRLVERMFFAHNPPDILPVSFGGSHVRSPTRP